MLALVPASAWADSRYRVSVTTESPQVRHFGTFSYEVASVSGPDRTMARKLTRKVQAYTMPSVDHYLKPSRKTANYLKEAAPAYFSSEVAATPGCHQGYVCLSQASSFSTPLIAGSIQEIQARAWSSRTGKVADLRTFVSSDQLPAFTQRVKKAIRKADCYYGSDIELPARYESYPNWVPLDSGIRVWFPEYEFGCQAMSLRIIWS